MCVNGRTPAQAQHQLILTMFPPARPNFPLAPRRKFLRPNRGMHTTKAIHAPQHKRAIPCQKAATIRPTQKTIPYTNTIHTKTPGYSTQGGATVYDETRRAVPAMTPPPQKHPNPVSHQHKTFYKHSTSNKSGLEDARLRNERAKLVSQAQDRRETHPHRSAASLLSSIPHACHGRPSPSSTTLTCSWGKFDVQHSNRRTMEERGEAAELFLSLY